MERNEALHLPLNRQSRRFKCEGIDLSVSTLADQVGAGVFAADAAVPADRSPRAWPPNGCTATTVCCRSTQKG